VPVSPRQQRVFASELGPDFYFGPFLLRTGRLMKAMDRRSWCIAFACAAIVVGLAAPGRAYAEADVQVFPGMEIHQGSTVCTLGMVQPSLRIALTSGECDGASVVTDSHGKVIGTVTTARHVTADGTGNDAGGSKADIDYEVIGLADNADATDVLPTGRQLQSAPGLVALPTDAVCHFGISTGQTCGKVRSMTADRFVITGMAADDRDIGGPVYTVSDSGVAIVGLLESTSTAESWQAAMQQLAADGRSPRATPVSLRTSSR
jgi:hypothetical protein